MKTLLATLFLLAGCGRAALSTAKDGPTRAATTAAAPLPAGVVAAARGAAIADLPHFQHPGMPADAAIDGGAPLGGSAIGFDVLASDLPNDVVAPQLNTWNGNVLFLVTGAAGHLVAGALAMLPAPTGGYRAGWLSGAPSIDTRLFAARAADLAAGGAAGAGYFGIVLAPLNRAFLGKVDAHGRIFATPVQAYPSDPYQDGTWIDAETLLNFVRPEAREIAAHPGCDTCGG